MTGPFQIGAHAGLTRLWIYPVALTLVGAALASPWRVGVVSGKSMYPTLKPGSVMIYDTRYYEDHLIRAGDVVLLKWCGETWVKRIYGVPGKRFWAFHERLDGAERFTPISEDSRSRFEALAHGLR